jgi:hypothetical protein
MLRWRHARTSLQLVLLLAALVVVVHGFVGPDIASANLATVLTWVHYRGLLVIALLAAGNLFCAGCPMVRVRDWGRRLHMPERTWPARLRGKWVALVLFAGVLVAYEVFDLWALPGATAWLVLAYFAAALVIDVFFKGATFCKHLCPIGQFNFVASAVSPLELQIREPATCQACRTSDCIAGRRTVEEPARIIQRGCELGLYLPAKVGNMDCTFCLDCVQACPHDNIALAARLPGVELADARRRSGIGRLSERPDIAVLSALFVSGAMMNAFAMTRPVRHAERWIASVLGSSSDVVVISVLFVLGAGIIPLALLAATAAISRRLAPGPAEPVAAMAARFVHGFVPFGSSVWLAHYGFHLLTGALVVIPVTQSAVVDLFGTAALGEPMWRLAGMRPGAVLPLQMGAVVVGMFGSLAIIRKIAQRDSALRADRTALPWQVLLLLLTVAALWILFQPMEMRGIGIG